MVNLFSSGGFCAYFVLLVGTLVNCFMFLYIRKREREWGGGGGGGEKEALMHTGTSCLYRGSSSQ